ncbi:2,3-diaminopropionate biosynthesis protein SbnB [Micromonospora sp. NPDC007230]|uniref:2,3-diaminopropionate biosynthesis protein SbnB n=1 Tax=Micromonospora sp. NPDC007230 TaxID=3364237 RepID=UPI0036B3A572
MPYAPPEALLVVRGAEVAEQIEGNRETVQDIVRDAYLTHARGDSSLPHSSFLRFPDRERDRIIALPGYLGGRFRVSGVKWIASFPGNITHGLARASAVLLLNDARTGFPYACLESSLISAARTAGSATLAAEELIGGRRAGRVGFVGTGLIAEHIRRFLTELGWEIGGYRLFDTDPAAAERFAQTLRETGAPDVRAVGDVREAFSACDLVILATVAGTPHLADPQLLRHAPVVLHVSLRDLDPALIAAAQNVTDDIGHVVRERTSLHLAAERFGHQDFIDGTLADVLTGGFTRDPGRAVVFSPFGLGVLDLAVGKHVYDRVAGLGGGSPVAGFFPAG